MLTGRKQSRYREERRERRKGRDGLVNVGEEDTPTDEMTMRKRGRASGCCGDAEEMCKGWTAVFCEDKAHIHTTAEKLDHE